MKPPRCAICFRRTSTGIVVSPRHVLCRRCNEKANKILALPKDWS